MSFFLRNTLGFFIQLYPCALMIFLPFSEESLRLPRKRIFPGITVISILLALIFPGILYGAMIAQGEIASGVAANLYMLLALLLALAAHILFVRETLVKKMLAFYTVLFYAAAQYSLVCLVSNLYVNLPAYSDIPAYTVYDLLAYAATTAFLLPLMLRAVIRPLEDFNREIEPGTMRREFFVTTVSTTFCFALMVGSNMVWRTAYAREQSSMNWLLSLYLFLIFNQGVIYWLVFRESVRRQRDNERQRFLEVQWLQYEKIAGEIESTGRLRHDLRHHMNTLGALNAQGKQAEITEYLKRYGTVVELLNDQKLSGDPVVDSILEYYLALAYDDQITVEHQVTLNGRSGVDPVDMTVLLGNCLENALEALRQLPEGERRLSIEMMPAKSMLVLRIRNTCAASLNSGGAAGWEEFVPRKETVRRGVGLRSVAAIAEKYGGNAQFQCKDGVFTTRVILNPTAKP